MLEAWKQLRLLRTKPEETCLDDDYLTLNTTTTPI
jgi:hypothetical protein